MDGVDEYERYRADARVLMELGEQLHGQGDEDEVTISAGVANAAVLAWERDEEDLPPEHETPDQWSLREAAATLALIGLSIQQQGVHMPDGRVRVHLEADLVQAARIQS
jgi:hypothetical protein